MKLLAASTKRHREGGFTEDLALLESCDRFPPVNQKYFWEAWRTAVGGRSAGLQTAKRGLMAKRRLTERWRIVRHSRRQKRNLARTSVLRAFSQSWQLFFYFALPEKLFSPSLFGSVCLSTKSLCLSSPMALHLRQPSAVTYGGRTRRR